MDVRQAVREFFNRAAAGWDQGQVVDYEKLRVIASLADLRPGVRVLDVGTGTGVLLPHLAARVAPEGEVVGLDVSPSMLEYARRKSAAADGQVAVSLVLGDVHALPFPDATFSAVTCYSTFPHLDEPARALTEMARVLLPGGRLVVAHSESRLAVNRRHREIGGVVISHVIPEVETMARLFRSAGLKPVLMHDGEDMYLAVAVRD